VGTHLQAQGPSSRNPSDVGSIQFVDEISHLFFSDHGIVSLAMEAIGDITASAEVSRVAVEGYEFDTRIQGGVFGDGVGMYLESLPSISLPNLLLRRPA
jgi:hypothetical protein